MSRPGQSSGQTLPLFAIFLPGMLALMSLGLDGAQLFLERREAQSAADLAALAGVRSLPDTPLTAIADAKAVGTAHGFADAQVVPVTPYGGDASQIEVTINSSIDTFFMSILSVFGGGDFGTMDVSARAVAESQTSAATGGGDGFAIFALESCPSDEKSIDISGSDSLFVGRVHSNSDVYVSGSNMTVNGDTEHTCGSPSFHDGGGGNAFNPAPIPGTYEPDPVNKTYDDYTCTFLAPSTGDWDLSSNGPWWVGGSKDSKTLRAGTYCARGNNGFISLGDSEIVIEDVASGPGGVTFVSKWMIDISGSDFELRPHEFGVLLHAEGAENPTLKMAGSGGHWVGIMYAPNGTAEVSGQGNINIQGGIVGNRVKLNGSNASINGNPGGGEGVAGEQTIALIE